MNEDERGNIDGKIAYYQGKQTVQERAKKDLTGKLETLKKAESKLTKQIQDFEAFTKSYDKVCTSISDSQFKGSRQKDYKAKHDKTVSELNWIKGKHKENLGKITAKISELELTQGQVEGSLVEIGQAIENLYSLLWES